MRGLAFAVAATFAVSASSVFAQAAGQATQPPAGQTAPAGQAAPPRPAQPATTPATPPARPAQPAQPAVAQPAPTPQPPMPFPQGAKMAFVNLQAIAQLSADGKAASSKVSALAQKKQVEAAEKAKALQGNQQKLETSGSVMSESARGQLQKEIDRQTLEGQRFEQDAQAELQELQQQLQQEFQGKLMPVLESLSKEKGIQVLFSAGDSGLIWAEPGIDLTLEAVKRLDTPPAK